METVSQGRLYRLAKRLSLGRFLRYLEDLWARYGWRRGKAPSPPGYGGTASLAAALGRADVTVAKRMSVASWFPLELANARLHRALLASVAVARPDLGVTPEILECLSRLKSAEDLSGCVDPIADRGEAPRPSTRPSTCSSPLGAFHDRLAPSSPCPDRHPIRR